MIQVNRVYVDAEGVVRMSPTGWPENPHEVLMLEELHPVPSPYACQMMNDLQKAKEESIPFEDEEDELDIKMLILAANKEINVSKGLHAADIKKDEFYTIEPIHVEIVDSWGPFHENTFPDKFARIVTEEEKPADYETPLHSLVNGLMQPAPEESIENQLFWYWIVSTPGCSVDSVWVQHNGVSRPVAVFRVTSIKGCPL